MDDDMKKPIAVTGAGRFIGGCLIANLRSRGVRGRNSDNALIRRLLAWEPDTALRDGIARTCAGIEGRYMARLAGKRTVQ